MSKARNFSKIAPNKHCVSGVQFLRALLFNFRKERIGQDKEVASSPRDGRKLWSGKEKHEAEIGTQVVLHS